jgi:hypothetical protein
MNKIKLEQESKFPIVKHDLKRPLILAEPHIGEATWVPVVYCAMFDIAKRNNAMLGLSGDLINADDLRDKGMVTKESTFEQIIEFDLKFTPFNIRFILQNNHGTRMYGRSLPRQFGDTLVSAWEKVLKSLTLKNKGITIFKPDDTVFELHLTDETKTLLRGLVFHPSGAASADAFIQRLTKNIGNYDFIILFHFHISAMKELTKQLPEGYMTKTQFYCVPPMIENPKYGFGKFAPIDAGFLVIHKDAQSILEKPIIRFDPIQKSDINGKVYYK